MIGQCGLVGISDQSFSSSDIPGLEGQSWACGEVASKNGSTRISAIRPGTSGATLTVGVALDASSGNIWFSRNGVWINGGDPASGTKPTFLAQDYGTLYPVVGIWNYSVKNCSGAVQFSANFGASPFLYTAPQSFLRLQTDECDCSQSYLDCLGAGGCNTDARYVGMVARLPQACGFPPSPGVCSTAVAQNCNILFQSCSGQPINQVCTGHSAGYCNIGCSCVGAWFDCMWQGNCTFNNTGMSEYGDMCLKMGCTFQECGVHYQPPCSLLTTQCTSNYLSCENSLSLGTTSCSCLAEFYNCVNQGGCFTVDSLQVYEMLCISRGCSTVECGYSSSAHFQICNHSRSAGCDNSYLTCVGKPVGLSVTDDECSINYVYLKSKFGLSGPRFCNDTMDRGLFGCVYDFIADICYTPSVCSCIGTYYDCANGALCLPVNDSNSFSSTCEQLGCTAAQCNLASTVCNVTGSTICGGRYLDCDKRVTKYSTLLPANYTSPDLGCYDSYCLWDWQQCMLLANCSDVNNLEASIYEYIDECQNVLGCSSETCQMALAVEVHSRPDVPLLPHATSLPGLSISVTWNDSLLAIQWVLTNSENMLVIYNVSITDVASSSSLRTNFSVVEFTSPNQVTFSNLTRGRLYSFSIFAQNMYGTGPAATTTERMLGQPSQPLFPSIKRVGPLQLHATWSPPSDFGDGTQNRPLLGYSILISIYPLSAYVNPLTQRFNVTNLSLDLDSTQININAGDMVYMQVQAINQVAVGLYSQVASVQVMGLPSSITDAASSQLVPGILVTWSLPLDTGFGNQDISLITTTEIQVNASIASNASNFLILVKTGNVCIGASCSYLIAAQSYPLDAGTLYELVVYTKNEVGSDQAGAEPFTQGWRIENVPSVPLNVVGQRSEGTPLQMQVSWSTPLDTGDGTNTYDKFKGYVVQVWNPYTYTWAQKLFDQYTLLILVGHNISGSNTFEAVLQAGQVVQVKVAASNNIGLSPFVGPVSALMAGLPSTVQNPSAVEELDGIRIYWSTPLDQGQGTGAISLAAAVFSPILVTSYRVVACLVTCDNSIQNTIPASQGIQIYQYLFPQSALGIQQEKVYLDILAVNEVGLGSSVCPTYCVGQSPQKGILIGWKITPSIVFPTISQTQMLQIAERIDASTGSGVTDIWDISSQASYSTLPLTVQNFPLQTQGTVIYVPVLKGSTSENGRVLVSSVSTAAMANPSDQSGLGSVSVFNIQAPVFFTGPGYATENLYVQTYPTKSVSIYMNYFSYPATVLVLFTPTRGPTIGGSKVSVTVFEPLGFKTRQGAGIANYYDSALSLITITFGTVPATIFSRVVNPLGQTSNVILTTANPPGSVGTVPVTLSVGGTILGTQVLFQYRNAYVYSVSPTVALESDNFVINITISDVGDLSPAFVNASIAISGVLCSQVVILGTSTAIVVGNSENQVIVVGSFQAANIAPSTVLPGQLFPANISVTLTRAGGQTTKAQDSSFLQLAVPYNPQVISSTVGSTATAIPITQPVLLTIQIRYLRLNSNQTIGVFFGNYVGILAACQQSPCTCPNPCSQYQGGLDDNYLTTIAVWSPRIASIPVSPIVLPVTVQTGVNNFLYVRSVTFMSLSSPNLYSIQPSEARAAGGTVLLAGVSGFCDGTGCVPGGFSATFQGQPGKTLGFVSLTSWLQQDIAYQSLMLVPELARVGAGSRSTDSIVIQIVNAAVSASASSANPLTASSVFLVFFQAPVLSIQQRSSLNVSIQATDNLVKVCAGTVSYFPNPTGVATGTISPSQILLTNLAKSAVPLAISLQNFLVVYYPAELQVLFVSVDGSSSIVVPSSLLSIQSSSTSMTQLRLNVPACGPSSLLQCSSSKLQVTVAPAALSGNIASLQLSILDMINNLSPTPSTVYTAGGDAMSVIWTNFYVSGMLPTDVQITINSGDGTIQTGDYPCPNTNQVSSTCTYIIPATKIISNSQTMQTTVIFSIPAAPITQGKSLTSSSSRSGLATVVMVYLPTGQTTAPFSFTYVSAPSGLAVVQYASPTQGSLVGGYSMAFQLTNFWLVSNASNLIVNFQSVPATVQTNGFFSGYTYTSFTVLVPAWPSAATVTIQISNKQSIAGATSITFTYFDPFVAVLKYPIGPSWPVGDSSSDNTVVVGVTGLNAVVSMTMIGITSTSIMQSVPKISVSQISSSTVQETDLSVVVSAIPNLQTTTNINITISFNVRSKIQSVTFTYTSLAQGTPYVISFNPTSYYDDGGIAMEIDIGNMVSFKSLSVQFSPSLAVVNASSVTAIAGTSNCRLIIAIPASPQDLAVIPVVFQGSVQIPFPSSFTYKPSPAIVIQSMYPLIGQTRQANSAILTLLNFPAVTSILDVVVTFGPSALQGTTVSVTRSDTSLDPMAIQGIAVSILTPIFQNEAVVAVQAYHRAHEDRVALSSFSYNFYDPDLPSITAIISGISGPVAGVVYVGTSGYTRVVVSLDNIPQRNVNLVSTQSSDLPIYFNNVQIVPSSFVVNSDSSATVIFQTQSLANPGAVAGNISFGTQSSSNFPEIPIGFALSFSLQYINNAAPQLSLIVPSTGSELGGDLVQLTLANFPIMSQTTQAEVQVVSQQGGSTNYATIVSVDYSDSSTTLITVQMPQFLVTSGSQDVTVSVTSAISETTVTNGVSFQYNQVFPTITSASPSSGSVQGGTLVYVIVSNFVISTLPVRVFFRLSSGDVELQQNSQSNTTANAANNQISLVLSSPASPAGSVKVAIYSAVSGPSTAVTFSFNYIDDTQPILRVPYPSTACTAVNNAQASVYIGQGTSSQTSTALSQSLASLSLGSLSAVQVQSIVNLQNGNYQFIFVLPNVPTPTVFTATIMIGSFTLASTFTLAFKDCSVPAIFDFNPKSVVNFGGSSVILTVQNLASTVVNSSMLTASLGDTQPISCIISSMQRTSLYTYVTILTPATPYTVGSQNLSLSYYSGGSVIKIYCTLTLLAPCDFDALCAQVSALSLVAVHVLLQNPPASSSCLPTYSSEYCVSSSSIQTPQLLLIAPSSGLVGTSQLVTATISSFPALLMTSAGVFLTNSAVQINAIVGLNSFECQLVNITATGSNFLSQVVTLTFLMPSDSDIPGGQAQLSLSAFYGTTGKTTSKTITRSVNGSYQFIPQVTGPIIVQQTGSSSCIASSCAGMQIWTQLTNFPYYLMQQPYDISTLSVFLGQSQCNVSKILLSSASATSFIMTLPANSAVFSGGTNATVTIIYKPFGLLTSGCQKMFMGLCADRAGSFVMQILPDPNPTLIALQPSQIQAGSTSNHLITLTVEYLPKGVALSDLDARLVTQSSPSGVGVGTVVSFVTDTTLLSQANPYDLAPTCTVSSCSIVQIVVLAPSSPPQGASTNVFLRLCLVSKQQCVQGPLTYVEYLVTVYPSSVQVLPGASMSVNLYINGFEYLSSSGCTQAFTCSQGSSCSPPCPCNCAKLTVACATVPLGLCSQQPAVVSYLNGGIFQATIQLPTATILGQVSMMLTNGYTNAQARFQVNFLQPAPVINPVDYPSAGSTQITVTAYWGTIVKPVLVIFPGGNSFNATASGTDLYSSYSVVRFTPPISATTSAGTVTVTLQAASGISGSAPAIQVFSLQIFGTPVVQDLEPSQVCMAISSRNLAVDVKASNILFSISKCLSFDMSKQSVLNYEFAQGNLDGSVPSCSKCILNSDSHTISIWVSNFPFIDTNNFAAIVVTFGVLPCSGIPGSDGRVCVVRSVQTVSDTTGAPIVYLTVSVPSAQGGAPGPVTVQVSH